MKVKARRNDQFQACTTEELREETEKGWTLDRVVEEQRWERPPREQLSTRLPPPVLVTRAVCILRRSDNDLVDELRAKIEDLVSENEGLRAELKAREIEFIAAAESSKALGARCDRLRAERDEIQKRFQEALKATEGGT